MKFKHTPKPEEAAKNGMESLKESLMRMADVLMQSHQQNQQMMLQVIESVSASAEQMAQAAVSPRQVTKRDTNGRVAEVGLG